MSKRSRDTEQMPTATAQVIGDVVIASRLKVTDTDFAADLHALGDPEAAGRLCESVLELGVRVRKIANTSADALHLAEQVKRLDETFDRVTNACSKEILHSVEVATNPNTGLIAGAVKRETETLANVITHAFDENDKSSALSKIQSAVSASVQRIGEASTKSVRELLDAANPTSPMSLLQAGIRRDVVQPVTEMLSTVKEVKQAIELRLAVEATEEKGTQKGRKYEELAGAALEGCAAVAGDAIENTGDTSGFAGTKTGDHVVTIARANGDCVRLVFESKDQKLSLKKTLDELTDAANNRKADVAIAVFSSQSNAPTNTPFSRIPESRYVVIYEKETQDELAIRVAYQAARAEAAAIMQRRGSTEFDASFVLARIAEARGQLDLIDQIDKSLTQASNGVEATRTTARDLRTRLRAILDTIDQNVNSQERGAA